MTPEADRRTAAAVVIGAAVAIALLAVLASSVAIGMDTCGGDGGSPYAAPDSPQGKVCDDLEGSGGYVILGGVPLVLVGVAIWVIRRWRRGVSSVIAVVAAVLAAPAWSIGTTAVASSASDVCSSESQGPYDSWSEAAREYGMAHPRQAYPIPPPNDCGHY